MISYNPGAEKRRSGELNQPAGPRFALEVRPEILTLSVSSRQGWGDPTFDNATPNKGVQGEPRDLPNLLQPPQVWLVKRERESWFY